MASDWLRCVEDRYILVLGTCVFADVQSIQFVNIVKQLEWLSVWTFNFTDTMSTQVGNLVWFIIDWDVTNTFTFSIYIYMPVLTHNSENAENIRLVGCVVIAGGSSCAEGSITLRSSRNMSNWYHVIVFAQNWNISWFQTNWDVLKIDIMWSFFCTKLKNVTVSNWLRCAEDRYILVLGTCVFADARAIHTIREHCQTIGMAVCADIQCHWSHVVLISRSCSQLCPILYINICNSDKTKILVVQMITIHIHLFTKNTMGSRRAAAIWSHRSSATWFLFLG